MLYKKYGFGVEGLLKKDKLLSDGNYYNTLVMGRFNVITIISFLIKVLLLNYGQLYFNNGIQLSGAFLE